jgi:hypothetical protein
VKPDRPLLVRIWHAAAGVGRAVWMVFFTVTEEKLAAWSERRRSAKRDGERR